jgi:hypothetical protein
VETGEVERCDDCRTCPDDDAARAAAGDAIEVRPTRGV